MIDGLDKMRAAAIPVRAEPNAAGCNELVEQVRHGAVGTVQGDSSSRLYAAFQSHLVQASTSAHQSSEENSCECDHELWTTAWALAALR